MPLVIFYKEANKVKYRDCMDHHDTHYIMLLFSPFFIQRPEPAHNFQKI